MTEPPRPESTRAAPLRTEHHPRDAAGLEHVYPVLSRRSGGVSIGINLNPNRACNWACVYCQVEGLVRGAAPPIDLARLARELDGFLRVVRTEEWIDSHGARDASTGAPLPVTDVAFSGDGEPTTVADFDAVVEVVADVLRAHGLAGAIDLVLITNGSQVHKAHVQRGLARMRASRGVVWYKLDRATRAGRLAVNGVDVSDERVEENLRAAAALCPTRIQTCWFDQDGAPPPAAEVDAWLALLARLAADRVPLVDVMLYGLARPSRQPGGERLSRVPEERLREVAARVEALGLRCSVHP